MFKIKSSMYRLTYTDHHQRRGLKLSKQYVVSDALILVLQIFVKICFKGYIQFFCNHNFLSKRRFNQKETENLLLITCDSLSFI